MQLGFIGLGKMGANMVERLLRGGHQLVVTNRSPEPIKEAVAKGAKGCQSLKEVVDALQGRKAIWLMIPAGAPVDEAVQELLTLLKPNDIVIDGGNSNFKDSIRHSEILQARGIHFLDAGTSGGIWGLKIGYCLMVGGEAEPFRFIEPAIKTLAPQPTPGNQGAAGYLHVGPVGAGHYVKMVHNGIEYAMMQAYGEGFELMNRCDYNLNLPAIAELWLQGSVVRSWLLELAADALKKDPQLEKVKAYVSDSGEGRWTVQEAIDHAVPAYTIAASLFARFASRDENAFGLRLLAALRNEFGGHEVKSS
jgi:6-phosphogluconate dehydrogenase